MYLVNTSQFLGVFFGDTEECQKFRRAAAVVASVQERGVILCGIEGVDLDEQGAVGAKG